MNRIPFFVILMLGTVALSSAAEVPAPVEAYRAVVKSKDKAVYGAAALKLRRWMIANDPHRPIYHFTGPESWINDPNGVIYHEGKHSVSTCLPRATRSAWSRSTSGG